METRIGIYMGELEDWRGLAMRDTRYIVVKPGNTWKDAIAFSGYETGHKPCFTTENTGTALTFLYRNMAEHVAEELGEGWTVWETDNILREVEKTYGVKVVP